LTVFIHTAFVFLALLVYAIGTHADGQRRHPSAALAWVLVLALLPYVGLPLYLLLGKRKFARPLRRVTSIGAPSDHSLQACAIATLESMGLPPPAESRTPCFHRDGQAAWDELEALITSARTQLDVCTFVMGNDETGRRVSGLLQSRAAAGVRVRLLLDAFGSWRTSSAEVRRLRRAGVEVRWFMPLLRNPIRGRVNLRNHRKLAIADRERLWTGGRNLADEYFQGGANRPPWIDLTFTITGPLALQGQSLFENLWKHSHGPKWSRGEEKAVAPADPHPAARPAASHHWSQLVPSGPDQADDTFHSLLLTLLYRATHRVIAVTPYFVPDDSLLKAMCLAARRGVRVELIIPARSNHRLADMARARSLRELVAAGGLVRLADGMVHAKAVMIDDAVGLCGSLNLDSRSLFLNFELMVAFYSSEDVAAITRWIDTHFDGLPSLQPAPPSLGRDIAEGLVRWLGFQI
jgi:cardiolipin synthase A/B